MRQRPTSDHERADGKRAHLIKYEILRFDNRGEVVSLHDNFYLTNPQDASTDFNCLKCDEEVALLQHAACSIFVT